MSTRVGICYKDGEQHDLVRNANHAIVRMGQEDLDDVIIENNLSWRRRDRSITRYF